MFAETNVDVDLRMLRSFRVLRPLKLVSKIPSESDEVLRTKKKSPPKIETYFLNIYENKYYYICIYI